jgi:phenylalanyl-tRNA synthetase beta chain
MKISYQWLKRFLDFKQSPEEVADAVTRLGLEVEEIQKLGIAPNPLLVVGEILSRDRHPNADKLSVCKVNVGQKEPLQIVCGAPNCNPSNRVPVALVGCKLLDGDKFFEIKAAKLRGVESQGMLCAEDEIGLGKSHEGLMLLADNARIGAPLHEVLPSDTVFEIKATPNRPDALSHWGIIRDLAAKWGVKARRPAGPSIKETRSLADFKGISVENSADCPHYCAYLIKGVKVGPSPEWLQELIKSVGLRPISNIVDITNFICLGFGQPLHAFDYKKIEGHQIRVRRAAVGEKLATLDGKLRQLDGDVLVIADAVKPLVIAGIMGGSNSEVDGATTDILLESAQFNQTLIRKTSRRLILGSDSSYRYERGIDPLGLQLSAELAVKMILDLAGGKLLDVCVAGSAPYRPLSLDLTREFIVKQLGFDVSGEKIVRALTAFGFVLKKKGRDSWQVGVPSFRLDVSRPVDLVEEVLRFEGVDSIPEAPLVLPANESKDAGLYAAVRKISHALVAQGYNECVHYTMRGKSETERLAGETSARLHAIENPLSADMAYLRYSLVPGLIGALELNRSRGNAPAPLFEAGRVFRVVDGKLNEFQSISFVEVISPAAQAWRKMPIPDFFSAKSRVEGLLRLVHLGLAPWARLDGDALFQPMHSATARGNGMSISAGVVNLEIVKQSGFDGIVLAGEMLIEIGAFDKESPQKRYSAFSTFPPTRRDVAMVVDGGTSAGKVVGDVRKLALEAVAKKFDLESAELFDLYQGQGIPEGHKSMAIALTFRSIERTLTDEEVNVVFGTLLAKLREAGYNIRG